MSSPVVDVPTLEEFRAESWAWLEGQAPVRSVAAAAASSWGEGSDFVGFYSHDDDDAIRARLVAERKWQCCKVDAGFGALTWPGELGGRGLPRSYQQAFDELESRIDVPAMGEISR